MPLVFGGTAILLIILVTAGWLLLGGNIAGRDEQLSNTKEKATPVPTQMQNGNATPVPTVSPLPAMNDQTSVNAPLDSGIGSNSKMPDVNDPAKSPPIMKTEDHSVLFNLHQCRKSGSAITCVFTFQNKGADRKFEFVAHRSNLYDELGNGYNGQRGQLANYEGNEPRIAFVSGVTTRAQITFDGIDPNVTKITLLRIQFDVGDDYGLEVKFRNVPLVISK
jgi:hypothetical protein